MGRSFLNFDQKGISGFGNVIKEHDLYGQPVALNYQGDDAYKTVPLVDRAADFGLHVLKGKYMFDKVELSLVQQTVIATEIDSAQPRDLTSMGSRILQLATNFTRSGRGKHWPRSRSLRRRSWSR